MSNPQPPDGVAVQLSSTRPGLPTLDERRGLSVVTQRLFGTASAPVVRLGRYVVKERLGSGGTGVVYRAWDPMLARDVAIKVLRRSVEVAAGGRHERVPLLDEGRRVAKLEHPAIVKIFSVEHDEGSGISFVVMALLPGRTLQSWLDAQPRTVAEVCAKFRRAAQALDAAHEVGVVHGDFKPANVLLDADGQPCVVDFGGRGTPHFMAPEQREGQMLHPSVDVHAFAVALEDALSEYAMGRHAHAQLQRARSPHPDVRPASTLLVVDAIQRPTRTGLWALAAVAVVTLSAAALVSQPESQRCVVDEIVVPTNIPPQAMVAATAFAAAWNDASSAACKLDDGAVALGCLARARLRWTRAAELVAEAPRSPDGALVIESVARPHQCLNDEGSPVVASPLRERFEQLNVELHAAEDLGTLSTRGEALVTNLEDLRRTALEMGDEGVEADAALLLGLMALRAGRVNEALDTFETAYLLAARAGLAPTQFYAAANVVWLYGGAIPDAEGARRWLERARIAAGQRRDSRAEMLLLDAAFAVDRRAYEDAIALYDQAEQHLDEDGPLRRWTELLSGRGRAKRDLGRFDDALEDFDRSIARLQTLLPEGSYQYADTLNGRGTTLRAMGRSQEAIVSLERLRGLLESEAPQSPDIAAVRGNLAQLYADRGEHARALEEFRVVHDIFAALMGSQAPPVSMTRFAIAEQLFALERDEEAEVEAEAALRWSVPEPYAGAARLLLVKVAFRAGRATQAQQSLRALLEQDALDPAVREEATALLDEASGEPSTSGGSSP